MVKTERAAIEAAKMTDEQLGHLLNDRACLASMTEPREEFFAALGRRARELLGTPTLPPEPPPGFVRARFPIAVGADGQWCVSAASTEQESESIEATDWFRREGHPSRISFITADAPLPSQPAEIVASVETGDGE